MQPDHMGLNVRDLDVAIAFFGDWFGFTVLARWEAPRQAFIARAGWVLGLQENPHYDYDAHTLAHLAFSGAHAEFERLVARIRAEGLPVVSGPSPQRGGASLVFREPSGNLIEICHPPLCPVPP